MFLLLLLLSWLSGLSWLSWLAQAVEVKSVPPAPVRVLLKSSNMSHMLRWDRGAGTAPEVTYSVSFHTDSGRCCTVVPGCERVVERLLCDLTKAFSDPEETYHMRVTAHLRFEQSSSPWLKLSPLIDKLQLPVLQLVHCGSSLCVDMEAPVSALYPIYDSFWYELKIQVDSEQPTLEHFKSLQRRKVQPIVKAGSRYCLSIRVSDKLVPRESNFSDPQCVYIHSPIPAERPLAVVAALLMLLLLVFLALVYSGCICLRRQALPSVLTSVRHLEKRLMVFHPPVSSLSIIKQAAPSYGQTECCSSESDYSEDESDKMERRGDANAASYTSKGSLCSALSLSSSAPHSNTARKGGAEQETAEKMDRAEEERAEEERAEEERAEEERAEEERAEEERAEEERAEEERAEEERAEEGLRMDRAEEVNLLTLTFSRDTDLGRDSAVVVSETELPVWVVEEEQQEPEEGFEEECCQSGYMSR